MEAAVRTLGIVPPVLPRWWIMPLYVPEDPPPISEPRPRHGAPWEMAVATAYRTGSAVRSAGDCVATTASIVLHSEEDII